MCAGVTVPPVSFNTFLEWDTLVVNTWDGLGMHSCACSPNLEELPAVETRCIPQPFCRREFDLSATEAINASPSTPQPDSCCVMKTWLKLCVNLR